MSQVFFFAALLCARIVECQKREVAAYQESYNQASNNETSEGEAATMEFSNDDLKTAMVTSGILLGISIVTTTGFICLIVVSIVFIVAGCVVAAQWPRPNFCCWTIPMSDKNRDKCCCFCSLYRTNITLAGIWLVLFILSFLVPFLEPGIFNIILGILHIITSSCLIRKFKKFGRPALYETEDHIAPVVQMKETTVVEDDENPVVPSQEAVALLNDSTDKLY